MSDAKNSKRPRNSKTELIPKAKKAALVDVNEALIRYIVDSKFAEVLSFIRDHGVALTKDHLNQLKVWYDKLSAVSTTDPTEFSAASKPEIINTVFTRRSIEDIRETKWWVEHKNIPDAYTEAQQRIQQYLAVWAPIHEACPELQMCILSRSTGHAILEAWRQRVVPRTYIQACPQLNVVLANRAVTFADFLGFYGKFPLALADIRCDTPPSSMWLPKSVPVDFAVGTKRVVTSLTTYALQSWDGTSKNLHVSQYLADMLAMALDLSRKITLLTTNSQTMAKLNQVLRSKLEELSYRSKEAKDSDINEAAAAILSAGDLTMVDAMSAERIKEDRRSILEVFGLALTADATEHEIEEQQRKLSLIAERMAILDPWKAYLAALSYDKELCKEFWKNICVQAREKAGYSGCWDKLIRHVGASSGGWPEFTPSDAMVLAATAPKRYYLVAKWIETRVVPRRIAATTIEFTRRRKFMELMGSLTDYTDFMDAVEPELETSLTKAWTALGIATKQHERGCEGSDDECECEGDHEYHRVDVDKVAGYCVR